MFPAKLVMLKEHFRCVETHHSVIDAVLHENLHPFGTQAERKVAPPLIDIFAKRRARRGRSKDNPAEAEIWSRNPKRLLERAHYGWR